MGTDMEIPAKLVSCKNGVVEAMWKFERGEWFYFVDGVDSSKYLNMFEKIQPHQGFWVLCK